MLKEAVQPPSFLKSVYGPEPREKRAAGLPGMVSLGVRDLFPSIIPEVYGYGDDISIIRKAAEEALAGVDMGMIRAGDTVNVASCEHGFSIMGGEPYAEMLRTIRDVVQERTGCENIRLRVGAWDGFREAEEVIEHFGLRHYFGKGKVAGFGPWDKGVPIDTEVGTFYGIKKVYNADWFVHAYYDDAREIYLHRYLGRLLKAFVMAFARLETRGLYHNFPTRSGNFLPKAIFDSPFVQQKYTFTCLLRSSPAGITGIDADNDIYKIDRRITVDHLRDYGKMQELFTEIDECVAVVDGGRWIYYVPTGGLCFCELLYAKRDHFDLSNPITTAGWDLPDPDMAGVINPAVKALVVNQAWRGIPAAGIAMLLPTILVGQDMGDLLARDAANPGIMDLVVTAETLDAAMLFAQRLAQTDKVIVFDGSFGHINLSPSLGQRLIDKAPEISRKVEELVPIWLKQRGIDPETT
ncbi:MAG: hypothetical protein JRJ20_08020 [Deltaproteobacteria bacterium]|nr:hypothetical protein [Deltaproteobacteria bacterium]